MSHEQTVTVTQTIVLMSSTQ